MNVILECILVVWGDVAYPVHAQGPSLFLSSSAVSAAVAVHACRQLILCIHHAAPCRHATSDTTGAAAA
jgi:hypothetical protein